MIRATPREEAETVRWLEVVRGHVSSLRFGLVQIVIHDGRVVQIEKTEKVRLDKADGQAT